MLGETITVTEYDYLVAERTIGDSRSHALGKIAFEDLVDFVLETVLQDGGESAARMMNLTTRFGRRALQAKNYVGTITTTNGVTVEILPKTTDLDDADTDRELLIKMLEYLRGAHFKNLGSAALKCERMELFEVFVAMYADEVERLVGAGLKSAYVYEDSNSRFFRGKLLVSQDLKHNPIDKSRVYVRKQSYLLDRPENRILKATLELLLRKSGSTANRRRIKTLLGYFPFVGSVMDLDVELAKCSRDRGATMYSQALEWSCVFLRGRSFTIFSGDTVSQALLFPMERIFEDYVAGKLSSIAGRGGWRLILQDSSESLFDKGSKTQLRPDIVMIRGDEKVVLDTKWKTGDVVRSDQYQMFAYGKRYSAKRVILVYPSVNGRSGVAASWSCTDPERPFSVDAYCLDLAKGDEGFEALVEHAAT